MTKFDKEAVDHLILMEGSIRFKLISADEPDARITVRFIDHPVSF